MIMGTLELGRPECSGRHQQDAICDEIQRAWATWRETQARLSAEEPKGWLHEEYATKEGIAAVGVAPVLKAGEIRLWRIWGSCPLPSSIGR